MPPPLPTVRLERSIFAVGSSGSGSLGSWNTWGVAYRSILCGVRGYLRELRWSTKGEEKKVGDKEGGGQIERGKRGRDQEGEEAVRVFDALLAAADCSCRKRPGSITFVAMDHYNGLSSHSKLCITEYILDEHAAVSDCQARTLNICCWEFWKRVAKELREERQNREQKRRPS